MANLTSVNINGALIRKEGTESLSASSGNEVINGTAVSLGSTTLNYVTGCYVGSGKSVIIFQDEAGGYYGKPKSRVATTTGSSISLGTVDTVDTSSDADRGISIAYDTANSKVFALYGTNNNHKHTMIVGTVSGTNVSWGTAATAESGSTPNAGAHQPHAVVWVGGIGGDTTNRLVGAYEDQLGNSKVRLFSISGSTHTVHAMADFGGSNPNNISLAYVGGGKIVAAWLDNSGNNPSLHIRPGTVTGGGTNTIQWGVKTDINITMAATRDTCMTNVVYDQSSGKILVFYAQANNTKPRWIGGQLTSSGASLEFTYSGAAEFDTGGAAESFTATYHSTSNKVLVYYKTNQQNNQTQARAFTYDSNSGNQVIYNISSASTWLTGDPNTANHAASWYDSQNNKILYVKTNVPRHPSSADPEGYVIASDLMAGIVTINLSTGNYFEIDLQSATANITQFTINESLSGTQAQSFFLKITQSSTARSIIWSSITNIKWPASTGPTISTGNDAVDILKFTTYDQGTTWHGETIGQNFS